MKWQPPETAPKDGKVFLFTTAGPQMDLCWWDGKCFRDYYHKQEIAPKWPYMIGWKPLGRPAKIASTAAATRRANRWPPRRQR